MAIKYDEFKIFELLECEPTYIHDKEAGIAMYSVENSFGVELILTIDAYGEKIRITLSHQKSGIPLFRYELTNVKSIDVNEDAMFFICENQHRQELLIKPSFSLDLSNI
ncbi:MAG: hypothetical protein JXR88_04875 [Clostridia bacterium]|nr:hypothetical protein [Clostridia bacterium]